MSKIFTHYLITRFNLPIWGPAPDQAWLKHRWPLFMETMASVQAQEAEFQWLLLCDYKTPQPWVAKINEHRKVYTPIWTGKDWLAALQFHLNKHGGDRIITTRLDNDDIILPGYLAAIQDAYDPHLHFYFIDAPGGFQSKRGVREYDMENNHFLSLVETKGNYQSAYFVEHGKRVNKYTVRKLEGRHWVQVIHERNKCNG